MREEAVHFFHFRLHIMSMKKLYIGSLLGALLVHSLMVELAICSSNFTDQLALLSFKSSINFDPNNVLSNWTQETDFCGWVGVLCSRRRQRVTGLILRSMGLQGTISSHVGNLSFLRVLDLRNNSFHGHLTNEIGRLLRLRLLVLAENNLTGTIPPSFGNATSLKIIALARNYICGRIPTELAQLPKLQIISLSDNYLTDLRFNELSGPIPLLVATNFLISHNKFTEIPLALCNVSSIKILDLSHNSLSGVIPQCLGNFSNVLSVLDLRMNDFHGSIPTSFVEGNKLRSIDLNGNQLEGKVPRSLATCSHLEVLDFGNNNINDTFPYWLETLPELQVLVFQSNKFHGPMGSSKTQLPFPKLRILDLSHNEFSGFLPTTYFKHFKAMKIINETVGLRYMGESYYHDSVTIMIKGLEIELPGILTIFTTIDLSHNKFSGEIPNVIGKLYALRLLNLSHNNLVGNIPSSLGNLCSLESLDLSSNQLSGKIPSQLTSLTFLAVLNFSENHLEGHIPRGNQFETFDNSSYNGNLALCGFPLSKECEDNKTQLHPTPMLHKEDDPTFACGFCWKVVQIGYGCGMVLGLVMGYIMFLIGKPKWFVRIAEGEQQKKGKRSHKGGNRNGGRRK
ncbi:unnamed protein product [Camellia sinensis]